MKETGEKPAPGGGLLEAGLRMLGLPAGGREQRLLERYLEELQRWNRAYNLVRAGPRELVGRHLLDSLAGVRALRALEPRASAADVGSGAGFPGLPLAVFLPETRFTLVERSARRAAFLRNAALLVGLPNVEVLQRQLSGLDRRFDLVTLRAFAPLARELPGLLAILAPGGTIVAYKGRRQRVDEELASLGRQAGETLAVEVAEVQVPFLEEERHLVMLRRLSS